MRKLRDKMKKKENEEERRRKMNPHLTNKLLLPLALLGAI